MGHAPTTEQQTAREHFQTGGTLVIEAGAGTGKTSTMVYLAKGAPGRRGQYVAFNKAIVEDSKKKMPDSVRCHTAHGLAYRDVGKNFKPRLDSSKRLPSWEIANILGLDPIAVTTWTGQQKTLSRTFLAGIVVKAIDNFCMSADPEPTHRHVPNIKNLDAPASPERPRSYAVNNYVAKALEPALKRAWHDLNRFDGALRFSPGHYLKIWQLSRPRLRVDYILFDEAQDASPVMTAVVLDQMQYGTQLVFVGDSQQEIYGWAGAVNALAQLPADNRAYLSQSFRFGQAVADVANVCLGELRSPLRLTGTETIESTVGPVAEPHAVLCRTNATAIRQVMAALEAGRRPFLVGGSGELYSFVRAAAKLIAGERVDHPELSCFDSWAEVLTYVEEDEQGGDLRLMVTLVEDFGVDRILEALDSTVSETDADVVISTAHKSKGREWETVKIANDFKDDPEGEELRLLYVAVTRARLRLDITDVAYFTLAGNDAVSTGVAA